MGRALVVGASGQVGSALVEAFGPARSVGTYRTHPLPNGLPLSLADCVADPSSLDRLLDAHDIETVLIAAAWSYVDGCEAEPDQALLLNRDAPAAIARAASARGARTVLFSTEYVFDGSDGPYAENAPTSPISVYGRSKLAGEQAVQSTDPEALVIRTTVVYGPESVGKNFAYRVSDTLARGDVLRAPSDQISSPTYSRDLATATVELVEAGVHGVVNVVGPETMDRATFARRLARAAGLADDTVEAVSTASLGQAAPRPLRAGLVIDALERAVPGVVLRTVEEAAAHWMTHQRGKTWPTT